MTWQWVPDDEAVADAIAKGYPVAPPEERARIMADPQVQAGLDAYVERYERYGGKVPTITAEEFLRRLAEV